MFHELGLIGVAIASGYVARNCELSEQAQDDVKKVLSFGQAQLTKGGGLLIAAAKERLSGSTFQLPQAHIEDETEAELIQQIHRLG